MIVATIPTWLWAFLAVFVFVFLTLVTLLLMGYTVRKTESGMALPPDPSPPDRPIDSASTRSPEGAEADEQDYST